MLDSRRVHWYRVCPPSIWYLDPGQKPVRDVLRPNQFTYQPLLSAGRMHNWPTLRLLADAGGDLWDCPRGWILLASWERSSKNIDLVCSCFKMRMSQLAGSMVFILFDLVLIYTINNISTPYYFYLSESCFRTPFQSVWFLHSRITTLSAAMLLLHGSLNVPDPSQRRSPNFHRCQIISAFLLLKWINTTSIRKYSTGP